METFYKSLSTYYAYPLLRTRQPNVIFHKHGMANLTTVVRSFLNATLQGHWISRDGPSPWPQRPPDINPLDFFAENVKIRVSQ